MTETVLILVEDPGAANFAAGIPNALAARGTAAVIQATGSGVLQLKRLNASFDEIASEDDAESVLSRGRYRAVVVGSSENPDGGLASRLTAAARQHGIPTFGMVDGPANAHLRFRSSYGEQGIPDVILVPDSGTKRRFVSSGIAPDRIYACGHPHFDAIHASKSRLDAFGRRTVRLESFPELDPDQPLVVFLAERSDGLDPREFRRNADYSLAGSGRSDGRTEIVLEEVQAAISSLNPKPLLVVRLHPKNKRAEFERQASDIDAFSDGSSVLECVYAADAVVGMTSILLDEAVLLGRPTLAVLPRESEKEWLMSIEAGITPVVLRREDIAPAIARMLVSSSAADPRLLHEFASPGASERVADAILSVLHGRR